MLSEHERRQLADIEARLAAESPALFSLPSPVDGVSRLRARDRRRAVLLGVAAVVLLTAGHLLTVTALTLLGGLALYLMTPCWFLQDARASWARDAPRPEPG